jgi:hypothetical protein
MAEEEAVSNQPVSRSAKPQSCRWKVSSECFIQLFG